QQVDAAAQAALDQVGALVLVHVDALQKLRRNVLEAQGAAAIGREAVPAIELAAYHREPAHHHARAFRREVLRVIEFLEAGDRDAGYALQRLGHAAVRQLADVGRNDGVHDLVRIPLDGLRGHDALPLRGDD